MTVCTNDVALGDLLASCPPAAVAKALGDAEARLMPTGTARLIGRRINVAGSGAVW
jgi:hypothetical protein